MMTQTRLAERLIEATPWGTLCSAGGTGEGVGLALTQLLQSESPDEAESAYWRIENHAFIQEDIYEVAVACTSVLVASLADPRESWVRISVLDLVFLILNGFDSPIEGRTDQLRNRCHQAAREGLWLLVREAVFGRRDAALEILELLGEAEKARRLIGGTD